MQLYINSEGHIVAQRDTDLHTSNFTFDGGLREWTKLDLQYLWQQVSDEWQYDSKIYINGVFDSDYNYFSGPFKDERSTSIGPGRIGNDMNGTSPFSGSVDELTITDHLTNFLFSFSFDIVLSAEIALINEISDARAAFCTDFSSCPTLSADGVFGDALSFDGLNDHLTMSEVDFTRRDYTIGAWFKMTSPDYNSLLAATDPDDGSNRLSLIIVNGGMMIFVEYLSSGESPAVFSSPGYNDGNWHYVTAVKEGETLSLYMDGVIVGTNSAAVDPSGPLDISLGRNPTAPDANFGGLLDEVVIIASAVDSNGVQTLMNSTYPAIAIEDDFLTFTANASESATSSGTAQVDENAISGVQRFEQEVEAALQLQEEINYPITDDNEPDLKLFMPFEDVSGSTIFDNILGDARASDYACSGASCPTAGLRGQIDRAAFFDGLDDRLIRINTTGQTWGETSTIAVWVNGDRGTIVDTRAMSLVNGRPQVIRDGIELDFNRLRIGVREDIGNTFEYSFKTAYFDLPENEWAHLVATFDRNTGTARVYINGSQVTSTTASFVDDGDHRVNGLLPAQIGMNIDTSDPFHGFMDDLRMYDAVLSASEVQELYETSAPIMRFEFDEDENATTFADSSVNGYIGRPTVQTCAALTLNTLTVNSLATSPSNLYVALDGERLASISQASPGSINAFGIDSSLCEQGSLEVGLVAVATARPPAWAASPWMSPRRVRPRKPSSAETTPST